VLELEVIVASVTVWAATAMNSHSHDVARPGGRSHRPIIAAPLTPYEFPAKEQA